MCLEPNIVREELKQATESDSTFHFKRSFEQNISELEMLTYEFDVALTIKQLGVSMIVAAVENAPTTILVRTATRGPNFNMRQTLPVNVDLIVAV